MVLNEGDGLPENDDRVPRQLHRIRFVDWTPSAITALAFPPRAPPTTGEPQMGISGSSRSHVSQFGVLAVGRANGNIEICEWTGQDNTVQAPQAWVTRRVLAAPSPSKVDSMAFAIRHPSLLHPDEVPKPTNLRLFSCGGGSDVVEWDIERGIALRSISSQGGSIWCMAVNPTSTRIALGCDDGWVRLLSLEDNALEHFRRFEKGKGRVLSIAWGPPKRKALASTEGIDSDEEESTDIWEDSWLVTGSSDSCLRRWDVAKGRIVDRMETDKARGERTLVWAVAVLSDSTIISGDSMGRVKFWDASTATQFASFPAHQADVLSLAVGPFGKSIYSAGVDQKIVEFSLAQNTSSTSSALDLKWILSCSKHMHAHDVCALATWPPYSLFPRSTPPPLNAYSIAPVLASGGRDMLVTLTPCLPALGATSAKVKPINPLATSTSSLFEDAYQRKLAYPSIGVVKLAREARLLLCRKETTISVWSLLKPESAPNANQPDHVKGSFDFGWDQLLEMEFKVKTSLIAAALSDDGCWLAVSDVYETKLFRLERADKKLKPRRIKTLTRNLQSHLDLNSSREATGSSQILFSPDSSKLFLGMFTSPYVVAIDLSQATDGSETIRILRIFDQHVSGRSSSSNRVLKGRHRPIEAEATSDNNVSDEEEETISPDLDISTSPTVQVHHGKNTAVTSLTCMAASADGQWLATADLGGRVNVFNAEAINHHTTLPSFPQPIHTMAFDLQPGSSSTLVLGQAAGNGLHVFDVETRCFPEWARALVGGAGEDILPKGYANQHDPLMGLFFLPPLEGDLHVPSSGREVLAWGSNWICSILLDQPQNSRNSSTRKKRNAQGQIAGLPNLQQDTRKNFKMSHRYRNVLLVDVLSDGQLVVIERPLLDAMKDQPPPFFKQRFGT